jgi:hypothetical protein
VILAAFLAIAACLLLTEHTAHTLRYLPFGLLLLCPLLHLFMHGGHSGHGQHDAAAGDHGHGAQGGPR